MKTKSADTREEECYHSTMWREETKKSKPTRFQSYAYMTSLHSLTRSPSDVIQIFQGKKLELSSHRVGSELTWAACMYVRPKVSCHLLLHAFKSGHFFYQGNRTWFCTCELYLKVEQAEAFSDLSSVPFLVSLTWKILGFSPLEQGMCYPKTVQWREDWFPCFGGTC